MQELISQAGEEIRTLKADYTLLPYLDGQFLPNFNQMLIISECFLSVTQRLTLTSTENQNTIDI